MTALKVSITPPGGSAVDYTRYLAWSSTSQTMTVTQNFGRQGDTAQIVLVDNYDTAPHVIIDVLSTIVLTDIDLGLVIFSGVVSDPQLHVSGATRNEWSLQCTDNTFYADNTVVQGNYRNMTVGEIVVALTSTSGSGISAALTTAGGFVEPGPVLTAYTCGWKPLSSAWKQLAQLAGGSLPFGWFVDENLHLHFLSAASADDSGVTFTTDATSQGTQGHFKLDNQFQYEWDATSIHNRVVVQGAQVTVTAGLDATPTDTFPMDGTSKAWPLRFTPAGGMHMEVGGVPVVVISAAAGASVPESADSWVVQQNANGQWFLNSPNNPTSTGTIQLWYDYQQPITAIANDYVSQAEFPGPSGGVFGEFISDASLTTLSMAMARASREKSEYSQPVQRITFNTTEDWTGWVRTGQIITVDNTLIPTLSGQGVSGPFLVVQNRVTWEGSSPYRYMQVTAVRLTLAGAGVSPRKTGSAQTVTGAPGTLRAYTLTDLLGTLMEATNSDASSDAPVGHVADFDDTIALADTSTVLAITPSGWDRQNWGFFQWA